MICMPIVLLNVGCFIDLSLLVLFFVLQVYGVFGVADVVVFPVTRNCCVSFVLAFVV